EWRSALAKTDLRQFDEGARPVRQAEADRRQAVFLDRGHLAKGPDVPIGLERRIIAETGGAAWRPDQSSIGAGFDLFEVTVRPGDAQRGHEMCLSLVRRGGAALLQQALDPAHRRHEVLALAGPARRV